MELHPQEIKATIKVRRKMKKTRTQVDRAIQGRSVQGHNEGGKHDIINKKKGQTLYM